MTNIYIVTVILFCLLSSCRIKKYPRENELLEYIEKELKIDIKHEGENYLTFLLQAHICSACLENHINLISELNKKYNCIIILTTKRTEVVNWVKNKNMLNILYIGDLDIVSSYGLTNYKSEFIHILNSEIINWDVLEENKLEQIKQVYL